MSVMNNTLSGYHLQPKSHRCPKMGLASIGKILLLLCYGNEALGNYSSRLPAVLSSFLSPSQDITPASHFLFFVAFPSGGNLFYRLELVRPALEYAMEYVQNTTFIHGDEFDYDFIGTSELSDCESVDNMIVYRTIDFVTRLEVVSKMQEGANPVVPVGYFGPGCEKGLREMAQWLNVANHILFDAEASANDLSNKTKYSTLVRTGYTDSRLHTFYSHIFQMFGWKNATAFVNTANPVWSSIYAPIRSMISLRIPICGTHTNSSEYFAAKLKDIEHRSTVLLFFGDTRCVKEILVTAVRANLTRKFERGQIVSPRIFPYERAQYVVSQTFLVNHFFDNGYWGNLDLDNTTMDAAYMADLREAYDRTLVVSYLEHYTKIGRFNREILKFVHEKYPGTNLEEAVQKDGMNPTIAGYYTGVFLYAQAVAKILSENPVLYADKLQRGKLYENGKVIAAKIREMRSFNIPHIGRVDLDENGDFMGHFALDIFDTKVNTFRPWQKFEIDDDVPVALKDHQFPVKSDPVPYPPVPGRKDLVHERFTDEIIALVSIIAVVIIAALVATRYYAKKAQLMNRWWDIKPGDLKELRPSKQEHMANRAVASSMDDNLTLYSDGMTLGTTVKSVDGKENKDILNEVPNLKQQIYDSVSLRRHFSIAHYKNRLVATQKLQKKVHVGRDQLMELREVRTHHHDNLVRFIGMSFDGGETVVVTDYSARGTLADFISHEVSLQNSDRWAFRYSLLNDLIEALSFVHKSFGYHGWLTSYNCMIERNFVLKIRDYAPKFLRETYDDLEDWDKLWTAPEVLRIENLPTKIDRQMADIYSVGILLQEMATECVPYPNNDRKDFILPVAEIIEKVKVRTDPPFRPLIPSDFCNQQYRKMMESCWDENPSARPTVHQLKTTLREIRGPVKKNLVEDLFQRLQSHADQLEVTVEDRTAQLRDEQRKTQDLLHQLLPPSVADKLILKERVDPEPFSCVTVYFSDIVSFTTISAESTPSEIVYMLNQLYELFDSIIDSYDAYKVETIGDAYMVVSGLPTRNGDAHAGYCAQLALHILQAVQDFRIPHRPSEQLRIRIGMHSGPCVAGVVGSKMPRYCLFGDTINTASRMESTSEPNKIQLSAASRKLLHPTQFLVDSRGIIDVKGKGLMETFWLISGPLIVHANTMHTRSSTMRSSSRLSRKVLGQRQSLASMLKIAEDLPIDENFT